MKALKTPIILFELFKFNDNDVDCEKHERKFTGD